MWKRRYYVLEWHRTCGVLGTSSHGLVDIPWLAIILLLELVHEHGSRMPMVYSLTEVPVKGAAREDRNIACVKSNSKTLRSDLP